MNYTAAKEAYIKFMGTVGDTSASIESYKGTLKKFGEFLDSVGIDSIEAVTPDTISEFMSIRSNEVKPTSLKTILSHIRNFFAYMVDREIIIHSPVKMIHRVNKSAVRSCEKEYDKIITQEEFVSILTNDHPANTHKVQISRNRALLILLMTTGMRNESVRELRVGDLNFEDGIVHIGKAKGGKSGNVPFVELAQKFVRLYIAEHPALTTTDYLFGRMEGNMWLPMSRTHLSNVVAAAIKSYLPERVGFRSHSMRHTFASLCKNAGLSEGEIGEILLHSDGTGAPVTRRYITYDHSSLFAKVNAIFNKIAQNLNFAA